MFGTNFFDFKSNDVGFDTNGDWQGETFMNYIALVSVTNLPDTMSVILDKMFKGCISLTTISLPESMRIIRAEAFDGCSSLNTNALANSQPFTLPEDIEVIEKFAFRGTGISAMMLPRSLRALGQGVFDPVAGSADPLTMLIFDASSELSHVHPLALGNGISRPNLTVELHSQIVRYDAPGEANDLTYFETPGPGQGSITLFGASQITIPNMNVSTQPTYFQTTESPPNNFVLNTNDIVITSSSYSPKTNVQLSYVDIGSATTIDNGAFSGSTNLTRIDISHSVFAMKGGTSPNGVFEGCTNLQFITLPSLLGSQGLGDKIFKDCTHLKRINIPKTVTHIPSEAFSGCTALSLVSFHKETQISNIAADAFSGTPEGLTILLYENRTIADL